MARSALRGFSTRITPQSSPISGSSQVENSAGGYAWQIKWQRLERFLILGTEGGTYYIKQRRLTEENAQALIECTSEDGRRTLGIIRDVSVEGRAPKNDQALFALAYCISHGDVDTRRLAANYLPAIARTSTHLFQFLEYLKQFGGRGPVKHRAVENWYADKTPDQLAYQMVKYRQREGWTHRDALRMAKIRGDDYPELNGLFSWITGKKTSVMDLPKIIEGFQRIQRVAEISGSKTRIPQLIRKYNLPWEAVPTEYLNDPHVLEALLEKMPVMATIRQLPRLTAAGLLSPAHWDQIDLVVDRLQHVKEAKVHPIKILEALKQYSKGVNRNFTWKPVVQIVETLDSAFYKAFENVEPTGKTIVLGLDVSSSMDWGEISGSSLTPREAAGALALVTAAVEPRCITVAFSHHLVQFIIPKGTQLKDLIQDLKQLPFGGTDCSLPMVDATQQGIPVDCFQVYTDNETWAGGIHPKQALDEHRRKLSSHAKSIVIGMQSNGFSIADPNDPGMLDVVGFDTNVPALMADFVRD